MSAARTGYLGTTDIVLVDPQPRVVYANSNWMMDYRAGGMCMGTTPAHGAAKSVQDKEIIRKIFAWPMFRKGQRIYDTVRVYEAYHGYPRGFVMVDFVSACSWSLVQTSAETTQPRGVVAVAEEQVVLGIAVRTYDRSRRGIEVVRKAPGFFAMEKGGIMADAAYRAQVDEVVNSAFSVWSGVSNMSREELMGAMISIQLDLNDERTGDMAFALARMVYYADPPDFRVGALVNMLRWTGNALALQTLARCRIPENVLVKQTAINYSKDSMAADAAIGIARMYVRGEVPFLQGVREEQILDRTISLCRLATVLDHNQLMKISAIRLEIIWNRTWVWLHRFMQEVFLPFMYNFEGSGTEGLVDRELAYFGDFARRTTSTSLLWCPVCADAARMEFACVFCVREVARDLYTGGNEVVEGRGVAFCSKECYDAGIKKHRRESPEGHKKECSHCGKKASLRCDRCRENGAATYFCNKECLLESGHAHAAPSTMAHFDRLVELDAASGRHAT